MHDIFYRVQYALSCVYMYVHTYVALPCTIVYATHAVAICAFCAGVAFLAVCLVVCVLGQVPHQDEVLC